MAVIARVHPLQLPPAEPYRSFGVRCGNLSFSGRGDYLLPLPRAYWRGPLSRPPAAYQSALPPSAAAAVRSALPRSTATPKSE